MKIRIFLFTFSYQFFFTKIPGKKEKYSEFIVKIIKQDQKQNDFQDQSQNINKQNQNDQENQKQDVQVYLGDQHQKIRNNKLKTTKYNAFTLLPLYTLQFIFIPQNLFYILNAIAGYFIIIISPISNVYPIIISYLISLIREIIEDVNRAKTYNRIIGPNQYEKIQSKDIKQGDILLLSQDDVAPADCLLISSKPNKTIFVQTSALDGEQNFKPKTCVQADQQIDSFDIRVEPPEPSLSQFNGMIKLNNNENFTHFSLENVLLSCTKIESSEDDVRALVIYCGKQAKINQTKVSKKLKQSKLHKRVVLLTCFEAVLAVVLMLILPLGNISTMDENHLKYISFSNEQTSQGGNYLEKVVCYFILNAYFLPVSLFVVIELMRLLNTLQFNTDKRIEGSFIKNVMAVENLGEVDYIVSDKTGTLTKNQLSMYEISSSTKVEVNDRNIFENCKQLQDYNICSIDPCILWNLAICNDVHIHPVNKVYQGESLDEIIFIQSCLALGIQLTDRDDGNIIFEYLNNGIKQKVHIKILAYIKFDSVNKYSCGIYQELPIDNKYSLPEKICNYGQPFVLFKGSEQLLEYSNQSQNIQYINNQLEQYSLKGLRTLLFMHKQVNQEEIQDFLKEYPKIRTQNEQNEDFLEQIKKIKCNLQISGVTAIQDELQDNLNETIKYLSDCGIRQSMITGDRVETALNIGKNCGLVNPKNNIIDLTKKTLTKQYLNEQISMIIQTLSKDDQQIVSKYFESLLLLQQSQNFSGNQKILFKLFKKSQLASQYDQELNNPPKFTLLIDNIGLKQIEQNNVQGHLAMLLYLSESCIFARMSPAQKQEIVKIMKFYFPKQTILAIGDGANDRSMIKESDIGIAILGNEGLSAANVSDIVIKQFRQLRTIIAFHGRHLHNRYKELFEYQIEKNSILAFTNMLYGAFVLGTQTIVMDSWLLMIFNVLIAVVPIFVQSISEQDVPEQAIFDNPQIYRQQRYMRRPTLHSILLRMLRSVWYSICLIVIPFISHGEGGQFSNGTVSDFNCEALLIFLALLFTTSIEFFLHQNYYTYLLLASFLVMFIVMTLSVWILNYSTFFGSTLISVIPTVQGEPSFHIRWILTGLIASTPSIIYQAIRRLYYPDAAEIVRHQYGQQDNTCCKKEIKSSPLLVYKDINDNIYEQQSQQQNDQESITIQVAQTQ